MTGVGWGKALKRLMIMNSSNYKKQPLLSEISRKKKLELFLRFVKPGQKVLEIGSGTGWFATNLRERGFDVTTIDIEESADVVGDINQWQDLGMSKGQFDAVVGWEVIEHVDCLEAIKNLVKPDGFIVLSSPHPNWDWGMKILEKIGLTQKRTSEHDNLTDFEKIPLKKVLLKRPAHIHQIAVFKNAVAG